MSPFLQAQFTILTTAMRPEPISMIPVIDENIELCASTGRSRVATLQVCWSNGGFVVDRVLRLSVQPSQHFGQSD